MRIVHLFLFGLLFHSLTFAVTPSFGQSSTLRFRLTGDPTTLDWNLAHTSYETHILMNIMEGLVEEGPGLKPRPALAERWEISPDGKTYTFYLRKKVKWSDGRALKASDFVDSWLRLLNPKTQSDYASFLFDIENAEAYHAGTIQDPAAVGIRAIGDLKFQVKLRRIVPYFLHLPTFWVTFPIRSDLIKKHGPGWAEPGKIVSLGPYLLSEWKRGKLIRLTRNPSFFGRASTIKNIEIQIEPDDKKARELFEKGQLDFLLDATTEDLLKAKKRIESNVVKIAQFPYLATYYLGFNVKNSVLKDANIRRALAIAIDRDNIAAALQGGQIAARSWVPPGMEGYNAAGVPLSGTLYDARGTLAQAGYVEGRGFPKLDLWLDHFDGAATLADFIVKSLREKLGVEIEAHIAPPAEYKKALASGTVGLFVGHWGADFPDPANFYEVFEKNAGSNRTGWASVEYDRQLNIARSTLDQKARLNAHALAEKILLDQECVIFPLFHKRNTALIGPRVLELEISPLNYLFLKTVKIKF